MEARKNKKNKIYNNNDDKLDKELQENEYDNLKNLIDYNESENNKNSDTNSNILSNTYENMYEDFSSNYDDSKYESNDDLTEFYLYNEINNHKYNNNLYDFYLSKFNNNIEEKNKLNDSNVSFIDQIPYIINKKSHDKSKTNKSKIENILEKGNEIYPIKNSFKDKYNYVNKNENNENENLLEFKKEDNILCNLSKIEENKLMKKENTKKNSIGKIEKIKISEKTSTDNVYFNTLINKCDYTVSCYMYKKTNATHIYRKKILTLKKNFLIINKFKHNINNIYKSLHRDIYDISYPRFSKIYKNSNNIYKFSLYARRLSRNNASSNSDNSNFFSLKKKKKKKKNNYKTSKDGYNYNNEHIRLANHNLNIVLELINLMKIISIYGSLKKYIKVIIYKYTKNLFIKNYEIYCNTPKYFLLLRKFYNSINKSVCNYIYINILKIKNVEQLKYNYIYAIVDIDNFLYYYKYEYNKDMFIPLFSDKQNKIIFHFYTDYNLYLGFFVIYSYEIEKHIDFNLNQNRELNLGNFENNIYLSKKKKNISAQSMASSNKTESLFSSFNKSDNDMFDDSFLFNQKNIIFDKNYFFVRKLYSDQKTHIQKKSKYTTNSNNNIHVHLFIYKSKNRFEYLMPSKNTADLLCDEDNFFMSNNILNNNYQLINLFLSNIKRTMQIKNRFNYFLEKINNLLEFRNFFVSIISILYVFFCSYYKNYIHIIILLTILFLLLISNDKNYDFYKSLLYEFPILYLFFPYKILYKISKKSNLYHLHTFLHVFLLNKFPVFFQYLYKYYKYKCIYFFVYAPSYFNKYYNNYFLYKTNNDPDKIKSSVGKMSKIINNKKKCFNEICNNTVVNENNNYNKKTSSLNNIMILSSNTHLNNCYINMCCKRNEYASTYGDNYMNKQSEVNKNNNNNSNNSYKIPHREGNEPNAINKDESNQHKMTNNKDTDKNIFNLTSKVNENSTEDNNNKKNKNKNNKNEENINERILNNIRKYFKNKNLNSISTKKILRGNKETNNNDINPSTNFEKKNNFKNINTNEENIYNRITHIIKNNKQKKIESSNLEEHKNSGILNQLRDFCLIDEYNKLNEGILKKSYSDIKNNSSVNKKKDERNIFSDNDPIKHIPNNLHPNNLLLNKETYDNDKNSDIQKNYNFNKEIINYSNTFLYDEFGINDIMLIDLKVKIINNMKNNYYTSRSERRIEKMQDEENIVYKKSDNNRISNNEFHFKINNEHYSLDHSLYENNYMHCCKSYNYNSFSSENCSDKDIENKKKNNINRSYASNCEVCSHNKSSFYSINEYFPNYFYSSIEMIYINIILIFIYFYCFFIITVHGGLNNDFPLYFYFLNKKKKKKKKKNNSSEQNDENFKMYTKKKSDEKKYKSNFLLKPKHIFKNWKQKRKLNKKNVKVSLHKKESNDSNDLKKMDSCENEGLLFSEKKREKEKITNYHFADKDKISSKNVHEYINLISYGSFQEKESIHENSSENINIIDKKHEKEKLEDEYNDNNNDNINNDNINNDNINNDNINNDNINNDNINNDNINNDNINNDNINNDNNNNDNNNNDNINNDDVNNDNVNNDEVNVNYVNNDNYSALRPLNKKSYSTELINSPKEHTGLNKDTPSLDDKLMLSKNISLSILQDNDKQKIEISNNCTDNHNLTDREKEENYSYAGLYVEKKQCPNENDEKKKRYFKFLEKLKDIKEEKITKIKNIYNFEKKNKRFKKGFNILKNRISNDSIFENFSKSKENFNEDENVEKDLDEKETNHDKYIKKNEKTSSQNSVNTVSVSNNKNQINEKQKNIEINIMNQNSINTTTLSLKKDYNSSNISNIKSENSIKNNLVCTNYVSRTSSYKEGKIDIKKDNEINLSRNNSKHSEMEYMNKNLNKDVSLISEKKFYNTSLNSKSKEIKNKIISYMKNKTHREKKNKSDDILITAESLNSAVKEKTNLKYDKEINNLLADKRRNYTVSANASYVFLNTEIRRNYNWDKFDNRGYFSEYGLYRKMKNEINNKYIYSKIVHRNFEKVKYMYMDTENKLINKKNISCISFSPNEVKCEVFNKSLSTRKYSNKCGKINSEQQNVTDKNYLSKKKKKIFLHMKEKYMKLKNKNKKNFLKDTLRKIPPKQKSNIDNEYEEKKRNTANEYNIFLNDFIDEKSVNKIKKRMPFMNMLEKNNETDKLYYSLDEYSYCNNYSKIKVNTTKIKEYEVLDEPFSNRNYKLNKENNRTDTNELNINNIYKDKEFYNELDKNNIPNLSLINDEKKNVNKSQILKSYRSNKILNTNSNYDTKQQLVKNLSHNVLKKKKKREKHFITTMVKKFYKFLLKKKKVYKSVDKRNIPQIIYYNLLIAIIDYLLIITIIYKYVNNIYNIFLYSKHLHLKAKKKENKRNLDFNHIVQIIYHKNVFASNAYTMNVYKHKNMYLKKNIFKQIFVQNKKQNTKMNEKYNEGDFSSDSKDNEQLEIKNGTVPNKYYEEIKDRKNILSLYKSAKSNIKIFMSKHMILNHYLEKFLNLFNHKNFNLTKIVIVLLGYFSLLLFPINFHHLVILKILHLYYKGFLRRYHKNIILNSILEKIKNIKTNLKLYKPICSLSEEEYCALIEEINETCNQCLNLSQFKDINDEFDLAKLIMNNFREFSDIKKIVRHEWNFNLLNSSPHDNTNIFNTRNYSVY